MVIDEGFARASYSVASTLVLISIVISGILIGLGKAFASKRLAAFGAEELFQSIINGALVGGAFTLTSALDSLAKDSIPATGLFSACASAQSIHSACLCGLQTVYSSASSLLQSTLFAGNIVGFVSKLGFTFGSVSSQPFFSLESSAAQLGTIQFYLLAIMLFSNLQYLAIEFLSKYAIALLFPIGIFFRSFFATRKIGGAFLGLAIGAYIFFPLSIYLSLSVESDGWSAIESLSSTLTSFQQDFGALASVDLSDEANINEQINNLRERHFLDRVAELFAGYSQALSLFTMQNILMPLLGIAITAVAVFQLAKVLGGEILGIDLGII